MEFLSYVQVPLVLWGSNLCFLGRMQNENMCLNYLKFTLGSLFRNATLAKNELLAQ